MRWNDASERRHLAGCPEGILPSEVGVEDARGATRNEGPHSAARNFRRRSNPRSSSATEVA